MTGWQPKGNESSLPVWKPEPAKPPEEPDPKQTTTPVAYWPFPKVDFEIDTETK